MARKTTARGAARGAASPVSLELQRKRSRSRMVWGGILLLAGLITLSIFWDTASALFEKSGPVELNLAEFEGQDADVRTFLSAKGGYSRYVRVTNSQLYNFRLVPCDRPASGKGAPAVEYYAMLCALKNKQLEEGRVQAIERLVAERMTLEEFKTNPPMTTLCKVLALTGSDVPLKATKDSDIRNVKFYTVPSELGFQGDGFIGVLRPYSAMSEDDRRRIGTTGLFNLLPRDKEGMLYVVTLNELPPDTPISLIALLGPLLAVGCGLVLIFSEMRHKDAQRKATRKTGKLPKGEGGEEGEEGDDGEEEADLAAAEAEADGGDAAEEAADDPGATPEQPVKAPPPIKGTGKPPLRPRRR